MREVAFPAALLAAAIVVGGVPGMIFGLTAGLLVVDHLLDRIIGSTPAGAAEAGQVFDRLRRERRSATRVRRTADAGLVHLPDDGGWAAVAARRRLGVDTIRVHSIVGTVEQHKAESFDAEFRPPEWTRTRWTAMYTAAARGLSMPPISVYRIGNEHIVRDGHHRVSVLRALGADQIDAEIVELRPPAGVVPFERRDACPGETRRRRFSAAARVRRLGSR